MHQHTIRRIVSINDTTSTWKATSPHTLIASWLGSLSTSCSDQFFPSWLSKWAPYMDSLAETSCKCHVGLQREKNMKHTNTQRVELHVDMLIFFSGKLFPNLKSRVFLLVHLPRMSTQHWLTAMVRTDMELDVHLCPVVFLLRHWLPVRDVAQWLASRATQGKLINWITLLS